MGLTIEQQKAIALAKARKRKAESQGGPQESPQGATPEVKGNTPDAAFFEPAATLVSSALAEPVAGLVGLGAAALMDKPGSGAEYVNKTREALTYQPRTPEGKEGLKSLGKTLAPIGEAIEGAERFAGDIGYEIAGPVGGAIGATLPTAAAEALGLKGAKATAKTGARIKNIAEAGPDANQAKVLAAGADKGMKVLTSDVVPPNTFMGKWVQQTSEKMGPLGSGTARADQQLMRTTLVDELADEFGITLQDTYAAEMVRGLKDQNARNLAEATGYRVRANNALDQFGPVDFQKTTNVIKKKIAEQEKLGARADAATIGRLNDTISSLEGQPFSTAAKLRTDVYNDIKAAMRGEDTRAAPTWQAVKEAMDGDMLEFAKRNDRDAAADWMRSNRLYAEEFGRTRNTELKRILEKGEATPEKVLALLRGGKRSELVRLKASLTPKAQASARAAIIREAIDESGFLRGDTNPDRLATALGKTNRMQAVDVFFDATGKKELEGLRVLLDATRRAQQASLVTQTGQQLIPIAGATGIGAAAALIDPVTTIIAATSLSAVAKAYESKGVRALLMKIRNSSKDTPQGSALLDAVATGVVANLQAAKEAQEQKEQSQ